MNSLVVVYHSKMVKEKRTPKHVVLMSLALSDTVTDLYLIGVSVANSKMHGVYVKFETSWKHSHACFGLAFAQSLAMETSLLCLTLYSTLHILGIVYNVKPKFRSIIGVSLVLWLIGMSVSSTPLLLTTRIELDLCIHLTSLHQNIAMFVYNIVQHLLMNGGLLMLSLVLNVTMMVKVHSVRKNIRKFGGQKNQSSKGIFAWLTLHVVCRVLCWCPVQVSLLIAFGHQGIISELASWLTILLMSMSSLINPVLYTLRTLKVSSLTSSK